MRRLPIALFIGLIALAGVPLAGPVSAAPQTDQASPSPSSSSPSPTPSDEASDDPSPSPSATGGDVPSGSPDDVAIRIATSPTGGLFEMGDDMSVTVTVTNTSNDLLVDLFITDDVPAELDVSGVPIVDRADSINLYSTRRGEQIAWTIDQLAPGETVSLPWEASVISAGDLVAENQATVSVGPGFTSASNSSYLARSTAPVVQGEVSTAARPATRTKRVVHYEQRRVPVSVEGQAALPQTGSNAWPWTALAFLFIGVGAILFRADASRLRLCALAGLLMMTACIGSEPTPSSNDQISAPEGRGDASAGGNEVEDQVLGKRLHRREADGSKQAEAPSDEGTNDIALGAPEKFRVISVPVVEVVRVPVAQPAEEILTSIQGENIVTFSWDETARQVSRAASSRLITREPTAMLLAELATGASTIAPSIELVNQSGAALVVKGELGVNTLGPQGEVTATTSQHVDLVLKPGGSISLDFAYVLPSGDYSAAPFFKAD